MKTISLFSTNGQFKVDLKVDLFDNSDAFTIMEIVSRSDEEVQAGIDLQRLPSDIATMKTYAETHNLKMDIIDNAGAVGGIENIVTSVTALNITTTGAIGDGNDGVAYSEPIEVEGGNGPITWALTAGSLPSELTLDTATGIISGTPDTVADTTGIEITVTDGFGQTDVQAALTIDIDA